MGERVKGKVVLVTGAGSVGPGMGNGKASSLLYAREGARLLLADASLAAAQETERLVAAEGGEAVAHRCDVTRDAEVRATVEACLARYGRVDILHNNVGITKAGGAVELAEDDWDRILAVNLKSMFLTCKHVLPLMERQGAGAIVNIASINAIRSLPAIAIAYAASKAGVIALTREIAVQYAAKGIRANAILPGLMDTPMVKAQLVGAYGGEVEGMLRRRAALCPSGQQGDAWDTARAALFLASDEARYISGTTLIVDGALTARIAAPMA